MADVEKSEALPVFEEEFHAGKRQVETGRVRVRTVTRQHEELVAQDLAREDVEIERVPIDREVEFVPELRQEGDVTIVPIVEEVLILEKRLVLKEELHIRRNRSVEHMETPVVLRRQEAVVEGLDADDAPASSKETKP